MATIILGTAGQIFGGPIGGLLGAAVGGAIDRTVLGGGGRPRETGRISNPALQSATYGEPIPIIVGRMRVAGNLIWSNGISERTSISGGGKRSGPTTTTYSYDASFAVGLVAGRIAAVGRIWADGKVIRDANGSFTTPIVMRMHDGGEDQMVDPLIAAAQGADGSPAFRGLAYVVFEDMPLANFGNRIPNLTFEIIADEIPIDAGVAMTRIAGIAGYRGLTTAGIYPALTGHMVGRAGSLAEALAPLMAISDAALNSLDGLGIAAPGGTGVSLPQGVSDARRPGDNRPPERQRRASTDAQPGCLELAFYDSDRDFQPGLTRVRNSSRPETDQRSIAAAMTPGDARQLAVNLLASGEASRHEQTLRLPWRWLELGAGDMITTADSSTLWRIRERRFENFVIHLELVRVRAAMPSVAADLAASRHLMSSGRAGVQGFGDVDANGMIAPVGATHLHILDLPALPGDPTDKLRLWIAANSSSDRWRRTGVAVSLDEGASYSSIGAIVGGTVMGSTLTVLQPGSTDRWDRFGVVDIELMTDRDWLEGRSETAVLAGGNLALIGDELVQFADVEALAPRRFRLRGLLRGRRGTEAAVDGHRIGDRFILLDPQRMLAYDPPLDALGRNLRFVATGQGDADATPVSALVGGAALRPLSPCNLRVKQEADSLAITWVRRSRSGYGWHDFVDAPIGEAAESYRIALSVDGRVVHRTSVDQPAFFHAMAPVNADGSARTVTIQISQDSMIVGPGSPATIAVTLDEGGVLQ